MKILFAVWGNYIDWKDAKYSYNQKIIESKTTLPLLLDQINPDYSYIIISDTLINNLCLEKNIELKGNESYHELIELVKKSAKNFIEENIKNKDFLLNFDTLKFLVQPGIGNFSNSIFKGNPNNFYNILFYQLCQIVEDKFLSNLNDCNNKNNKNNENIESNQTNNNTNENIEIYLDITHGINYMTFATYRAIKDILQMLSFFYYNRTKITFTVLNSDPFQKKSDQENILNINEIEKIKIVPDIKFYNYKNNYILRPSKFIEDNMKKEIGLNAPKIDCDNDLKNYLIFSESFRSGLLPFIIFFLPDSKNIKSYIEKGIEFFFNKMVIKYNLNIKKEEFENENRSKEIKPNKIEITQNAYFTPIFQFLIQVYFISNFLKNTYNVIYNINEKDIVVSLKDLIKISELYKYFRTIFIRIENELDKLFKLINRETTDNNQYKEENKVENKEENKENVVGLENKNSKEKFEIILKKMETNFIDYGFIGYGINYDPSRNNNEGKNERNFYAHSGFAYEVMQIKKENDDILIKYKKDLFEKNIKNELIKNIPEGE